MSLQNGGVNESELQAIEALVNEFYHPSTTNLRKHAIEVQLQEFQRSSAAWVISLRNLTQFNNQFVWFFNVSTVEVTITQRWGSLAASERAQLRDALWATYAAFAPDIPSMQRDKIAQLIALIGKRQFPDEHSDYMNQVLELLKSKFTLGITLLRATSDEIVSTKADITSERQKFLSYYVSMYMPSVFDILARYASLCVTRTTCKNGITNMAHLPVPFGEDSRVEQATNDLLLCVQQIFSWATLDNLTTPDFFLSLFLLAHWNDTYNDVPVSALTTISELFYRQKPMPLPTVIATGVIQLLQQPSLKLANELYQDKLTELLRLFTAQQWSRWSKDAHFSAVFQSALFQYTFSGYGALAFTERLAIWRPIVQNASEMENFGSAGANGGRHSDKLLALASGTLKRMLLYYDVDQHLEMLDSEDVDEYDETELQHYLNQCIDQIALIAEIEPVRVFDMVFGEFTLDGIGPYYQVFSAIGRLLKASLSNSSSSNGIGGRSYPYGGRAGSSLFSDDERITLRNKSHDFVSLCQLIARISPLLLMDERRSEKLANALGRLMEDLVKLVEAIASSSEDALGFFFDQLSAVGNEVVEAIAQTLVTLRSLLLVSNIPYGHSEMARFVDCIPRFLSPLRSSFKQLPATVSSAAAQLLLSVSASLRPKYLVHVIKPLVQSDLRHLELPTATAVRRSICNAFLLPWSGCPANEQNYENRAALLEEYVAFIASDLLALDLGHSLTVASHHHHHSSTTTGAAILDAGQEQKIVAIASGVLTVLRELLDSYQEQSTSVKQMLAAAYRPVIEKTLTIYSIASCRNCTLTEHIYDFCLSIVRTLQIQLGHIFLKNVILLFLEKTTSEQLTAKRFQSLHILLKMFLLIVEQPGNASLLPDMLSFSIEHVLPLVLSAISAATSSSSSSSSGGGGSDADPGGHGADTSQALYALFAGILLHRWQYFYKSSVLKQFTPTNGSLQQQLPQPQSALEHPDQFTAIMNAYGQTIVCGNDPHVTRVALESLQQLNERWKLYRREYFREHLLQSFQAAIIRTLLSPEGILHRELYLATLYGMGEVDRNRLHETLLGVGFSADTKNVKEVCMATDYPTFAHHMEQLIQDTMCSQLNGQATASAM